MNGGTLYCNHVNAMPLTSEFAPHHVHNLLALRGNWWKLGFAHIKHTVPSREIVFYIFYKKSSSKILPHGTALGNTKIIAYSGVEDPRVEVFSHPQKRHTAPRRTVSKPACCGEEIPRDAWARERGYVPSQ